MKKAVALFLSAFLAFMPAAPVLAQDASPLEFETVHSDAYRLDMEIETVRVRSDWILRGSRPADYQLAIQAVEGASRGEALHISARPGARTEIQAYGTMMQMIPAGSLSGKRIRFSARLKSDRAERLTLWMRTDTPDDRHPSFYNMNDRPIRGTTNWTRHEIVLDVPQDVAMIGFGVVLGEGRGQAWADTFVIESVGNDVPVSFKGKCCDWRGREILTEHW